MSLLYFMYSWRVSLRNQGFCLAPVMFWGNFDGLDKCASYQRDMMASRGARLQPVGMGFSGHIAHALEMSCNLAASAPPALTSTCQKYLSHSQLPLTDSFHYL